MSVLLPLVAQLSKVRVRSLTKLKMLGRTDTVEASRLRSVIDRLDRAIAALEGAR